MKIEELRAICAAATQTKWKADKCRCGHPICHAANVLPITFGQGVMDMPEAQFIAQFDPLFVSKLLDVVEAAEAVKEGHFKDDEDTWIYRETMYRALTALEEKS